MSRAKVTAGVSDTCGIATRTVRSLVAQWKADRRSVHRPPKSRNRKKPNRRLEAEDANIIGLIKNNIALALGRGQSMTLKAMKNVVDEALGKRVSLTRIARVLRLAGYRHGKDNAYTVLRKRLDVQLWTDRFLTAKVRNRALRRSQRLQVWLDESYVYRHQTNTLAWHHPDEVRRRPLNGGSRFIVMHAGSRLGWVDGMAFIERSDRRGVNYKANMNGPKFLDWYTRLCATLQRQGHRCMIMMDNAKYHRVGEKLCLSSKSKPQLLELCRTYHIEVPKATKKTLTAALRNYVAANPREFRPTTERIAEEHGHSVNWLPPYSPHLSPIENAWGIVKYHVGRQYNREHVTDNDVETAIRQAMDKVTPETWSNLVRHIYRNEDKEISTRPHVRREAAAPENNERFIINLDEDDDMEEEEKDASPRDNPMEE